MRSIQGISDKSILSVFLLALAISTSSIAICEANNQLIGSHLDLNITGVSELRLELIKNKRIIIEAKSSVGTPLLHLFDQNGMEVPADYNHRSDPNVKLSFTPKSSETHTLLIRSALSETKGICAIKIDEQPWLFGISFGGTQALLENVRKNEEIETIALPNGAGPTHAIYIETKNSQLLRISGGGLAGGLRYVVPENLGTVQIIVGAPNGSDGPVRIIRNDVRYKDTDQDGLGDELEKSLGTCNTLIETAGNYNCSLATDPRDTDGDGISDGWEVVGRRDIPPYQPLAKWGADPRHKDIFIEADFMRRTKAENDNRTVHHMSPQAMHYFKKVYSDGFLTDTQRLHNNARTLRNPDGKPGISTHFDAGIEPPTNNDITLYGNWGGYDSVDAVSFTNNNGETKWRGASPANAYKHNIVTSRLGIFRYLLFYTTGGASQGPGWLLAFNGHDGYISAHETGHSLWLGHSAPIHLPIAADVNCKPNYASIMNYAFTDTGFSDGVGVPSLNNARLVESNSIDPANTQFLDVLENNFLYWIDRKTGSVDWNRDGFFAPNYQTVRAYANFQPGGDCEFTRYNQRSLPDAKSASTPSLVRISGTLYAFHTDLNGNVNYSVSTSDWNCPKPAPHCNGSSWGPPHSTDMKGEQGSDVEKVTIRGIEKALVISIDANGKLWQRLMQKNYFGNEKFYDEKEIPQTLEAVGLPSVAVTEGINPKIFLTFRGIDGYYHFNTASFEGDGTLKWDTDKYVFKSLGIPISADTFSSPAIKYTYFPTVSGKVLVGLFPTTTGHMEILRHNQSNSYWERFKNLTTEYHEHISGRPSLAFVPFDDTNTENGRIYIAYTAAKYDQTKQVPGEMRMLWSYREPVQSGTRFFLVDKIGLDSSFDNVWGLSFGMDLLYEHGIDYNLRALHTNGINKPGMYNALVFRPKADGINDFEYGNPNDWETLRIGLCKEITDPSGLITKQGLTPIKCPTWPSSN